MSLLNSLSIGVSALRANQVVLNTIAQNIANANNPNYHRQVVDLRSRMPIQIGGQVMGTGVDAVQIGRLRSVLLEESLTANITDRAEAGAAYEVMARLEFLMTPRSGSVYEHLGDFFDQLERLSAHPANPTQRSIFVAAATALTRELRTVSADLAGLKRQIARELTTEIQNANRTLTELTDLNGRIRNNMARGLQPNDLLDQRDRLVNELAGFLRVESTEQGNNQPVVLLAGGAALAGVHGVQLSLRTETDGTLSVVSNQSDQPLPLGGGKMAALLGAYNRIIPEFQKKLDELAVSLMASFDQVYCSGISASGPLTELDGQRSLRDAHLPLDEASPVFPIRSGSLFLSVTDQATGLRRVREITIDAQTDSLSDIAAALSVGPIRASVDARANTLRIQADPGFAFDFAGRLETDIDRSSIAGSAPVRLEGEFSGTGNDTWTFTVTQGGTAGVPGGPMVQVRRSDGTLLRTLDFGAGYEPGTPRQIADGVSLALDPGTLEIGDTFATPVIAIPDAGGLLTALGLNTLFSGGSASDIDVNATLAENPNSLALSRSGLAGDNRNVQRLVALRDANNTGPESQSFEGFLADLAATSGVLARDARLFSERLVLLENHLLVQLQGYSGVDINEEMVQMLQFQRGFAAAARVIAETDRLMDELFRTVG